MKPFKLVSCKKKEEQNRVKDVSRCVTLATEPNDVVVSSYVSILRSHFIVFCEASANVNEARDSPLTNSLPLLPLLLLLREGGRKGKSPQVGWCRERETSLRRGRTVCLFTRGLFVNVINVTLKRSLFLSLSFTHSPLSFFPFPSPPPLPLLNSLRVCMCIFDTK